MKVLHLEGGRQLFGGPRQLLHLLDGPQSQTNILLCPRGSAIAIEAKRRQIPCEEMDYFGDLDVRVVKVLTSVIEKHQVDVLVCHSRRGLDWYGAIASRLAGIKSVLVRRVDNREQNWLGRQKYKLYDKVICISGAIKNVLTECGVDTSQMTVVRDVVDAEQYVPQLKQPGFWLSKFGISPKKCVIGVVAQLIKRKGHEDLLQCIPSIVNQCPHVQFVFFGKGSEKAHLQSLAQTLNVTEFVYFAGFRQDMPDLLPQLDLVVHPAHQEGMGVALLQASACQIPVVAYSAGGIPEVVQSGENGYLVRVGDLSTLEKKIITLIQNPILRKQLGEKGRDKMLQHFSPEIMRKEYQDIYYSIAK